MAHTSTRSRRTLAALLALGVLLSALALTACNSSKNETTEGLVEGESVQLGDLEYNVLFSRYLNAADNEDSAYLVGQPPVDADGLYFGIFVQVKNQADEGSATLPSDFKVVDTRGEEFDAIKSDSLFALPLGEKVAAGESVPEPDSPAQTGPIEGSMILFQLPLSATDDRPLQLVIPSSDGDAIIDLDL